jgi:hypothetical protein
MGFVVTPEESSSSLTQTTTCWVKALCDPADDFANDD